MFRPRSKTFSTKNTIYERSRILKTRKIASVSFFEAFLCLFVIFTHVASEGITYGNKESLFSGLLFILSKAVSFVVPAFIFISAFKQANKYKNADFHYLSYLKERFLKIVLPYVLWVLIYYLYIVYSRQYFSFNFGGLLRYILVGDLAAHFYFIVLVIQFYILAPLFTLYAKKVPPLVGTTIALLLTLWFRLFAVKNSVSFQTFGDDRIFLAYFSFWIMGLYFADYYEAVTAFIKKYSLTLLIPGALVCVIHVMLSYRQYCGVYAYPHAYPVHFLFCTLLTASFYALVAKSENILSRLSRMFAFINTPSYYIYLSHVLVIFIVEDLLAPTPTPLWLRLIARAASAVIIPVFLGNAYVSIKKRIKQNSGNKRITA